MVSTISYAFIYLFQAFVLYIYFDNAFASKKKAKTYVLLFFAVWATQYGAHFLWMPFLNLTVFIFTVFLFAYLGYNTKIRSSIFHAFILATFMLVTELVIFYVSLLFLDVAFNAHRYLIAQAALSKLLFFVIAYLASKIRKKHEKDLESVSILLALSFAPLSSIFFLVFIYGALAYQENYTITIGLSVGTVLLLFSNMIVFFVYELTRRIHVRLAQLQLEQQRKKISTEYYELLLERQEDHRILAHDINRHLQAIQLMAAQAQRPEIEQYAASVSSEFGLCKVITYSGNKFVDVIVNRYARDCKAKGVEFEVDVRGVSLDFMSDMDITALLDNLLENALEAAARAKEKNIFLSFHEQNKSYVVIKIQNDCARAPCVEHGKIVSLKKDEHAHGIGLKSIRRIAAKYNGAVKWQHHAETATFEMAVVLEKDLG